MRLVLILLLLIVCSSARAQQSLPIFCDHKPVHLDWPESAPLQLLDDPVVTSYAQFSESYFRVKNKTDKPIIQFAALIELFDGENRHLLTLAPHAIAPGFWGHTRSISPYFEPDNGGRLDSALLPGNATSVVPASPIVITTCPAHASLTLLLVDDIEQKRFEYHADSVRIDPVLREHGPIGLLTLPVVKPFEKILTININEAGVPSFAPAENSSDDLHVWLGQLLSSWIFLPSMLNDRPLENKINILFRFHVKREQNWTGMTKFRDTKQAFVVIDLYPPESKGKSIQVSIGRNMLTSD